MLGLSFNATTEGVSVTLTKAKAEKWKADLQKALKENKLHAAGAARMAGRLSFTAQHTFNRLGRAMLRPLLKQEHSPLPHGRLSNDLNQVMKWWVQVLELDLKQCVPVREKAEVVDLFCDARGTPPRVAAILFADGEVKYTDCKTQKAMMDMLEHRNDEQIMAQELLAIALGLCSFIHFFKGSCVRVWSDNTGSECERLTYKTI